MSQLIKKKFGIQLETPAITLRGIKESDMKVIASGLARVIKSKDDLTVSAKVKEEILELTKEFPVYPGLTIFK